MCSRSTSHSAFPNCLSTNRLAQISSMLLPSVKQAFAIFKATFDGSPIARASPALVASFISEWFSNEDIVYTMENRQTGQVVLERAYGRTVQSKSRSELSNSLSVRNTGSKVDIITTGFPRGPSSIILIGLISAWHIFLLENALTDANPHISPASRFPNPFS